MVVADVCLLLDILSPQMERQFLPVFVRLRFISDISYLTLEIIFHPDGVHYLFAEM